MTVTFTEGGASIRGRVSIAEGQQLPANVRVYLAAVERENADNALRFFETRTESDGSFRMENIAPGRYWIIARPTEENESSRVKLVRQESTFRAKVLREAKSGKKEISFKPCERIVDYDLRYMSAPAAKL